MRMSKNNSEDSSPNTIQKILNSKYEKMFPFDIEKKLSSLFKSTKDEKIKQKILWELDLINRTFRHEGELLWIIISIVLVLTFLVNYYFGFSEIITIIVPIILAILPFVKEEIKKREQKVSEEIKKIKNYIGQGELNEKTN